MRKILGLAIVIWLILFSFRVISIGGLENIPRGQEETFLSPLQNYLSQTINNLMPYPQSTLLEGILLGSSNRLPFSLKEDLKTTSTIHMVVVSGQNLSMVAGFIMSFVYFFGRRKTILLAIFAIIFYSLLTGMQVPVIRAAIMVTLVYLAQILGKENTGWWVLLITAGLMLLWNPNWLLSISFQLSFMATLGVVAVAPVFIKHLQAVPKILREDLSISLAAQLLTLPIIAYNFSQISLIGIVANSLILWSIPLVMISGFVTLVVGLINGFLGQIAGLIPGILLTYFIDVVKFFAQVPGGSLMIGETSFAMWAGYYLLTFSFVWMLYKHGQDSRGF